jgi:Ca2+-binding RTX toxin-like protein
MEPVMTARRTFTLPQSDGDDLIVDGSAGSTIDAGLGNDTVFGRGGNDSLLGGGGNDRLDGNDGHDTLNGGDGIDTLYGNGGDDVLYGGAGDDVLLDDAGYAAMFGGEGNDLLRYDGERETYLSGGLGNDTLIGNDFADQIYAADALGGVDAPGDINWLYGRDGNDSLYAGQGHDRLYGGTGGDFAIFTQSEAAIDLWLALTGEQAGGYVLNSIEHVIGSAFADTLRGNALGNALNGSGGNDTLIGGYGNDTLLGGGGADRFVYSLFGESPAGILRDIIVDFDQGDLIDLSRIDADAALAGNQAFTFIGEQAFSSVDASGQVRCEFTNSYTMIYASVDADADAEFEIRLASYTPFSESDLLL